MKTICERCGRVINTSGILKGEKAFYFQISHDTEPHINTAVSETEDCYLCYDCSRTIYNAIKNGISPIPYANDYSLRYR